MTRERPLVGPTLRSCFSANGKPKAAFDSQADAREAATRQQAIDGAKRRPYRAYACDLHGWHFGHSRRRVNR